jgi:signal transduction histidine kinase
MLQRSHERHTGKDEPPSSMTDPADRALALLLHRFSRRNAGPRISNPPWAAMRAQLRILAVALLALAATAVLQALSFTVHSLSGHTTVETATGLIGALAAFVFAERARSTRRLRDFLTALSLGMLSATDLILGAGPTLVDASPGNAWKWIILVNRLVASGILIGAAFCPPLDIDRSIRRSPGAIVAAAASVLVAIAGAMLVWRSHLPSLLEPLGSRGSSGYDHPLSYFQIAGALLAASAAVGLARHAERDADQMEGSIAAGVAVLAIARLNYFLVPSLNSGRLYAGDILKLGAYVLILHGCMAEFRALQRKLAQRVAMDERRRMARDMHDGLAQELAFIATHSQRLGNTGDDAATVVHLRAAAERALHDSRTTIAVLTSPEEVPLDRLIARTVESFRSRFGVEMDLDLQRDVIVDAERRNALLRIVHEASINAIRHGSAQRILIRLRSGPNGPSLRIADDGSGFDVQAAVNAGGGLGLTSMQERAEVLGGSLSIASSPGAGAVVEIGLP